MLVLLEGGSRPSFRRSDADRTCLGEVGREGGNEGRKEECRKGYVEMMKDNGSRYYIRKERTSMRFSSSLPSMSLLF